MLRSPPMMPVSGETSLATIQSAPLALRFGLACSITFSVSAAKPMTSGGRLPGALGGDGLEDVGVLDQLEPAARALAPFLIFSRGLGGDAPVGHGGGEDGDVGRQRRAHGLQHLARGLDADDLDAGRIGAGWSGR